MSIFRLVLNDETILNIEARIYYYKGGMIHFEVEGDFQVASYNVEIIKTIINEDYRDNINVVRIVQHFNVRETET
ncbi:MAG: hypothetical protein ACUZ8E_04425 [Candidatus Anammoxibacter sp.]